MKTGYAFYLIALNTGFMLVNQDKHQSQMDLN